MNGKILSELQYSEIEVLSQSWALGSAYSYKMRKRPFWGICYIKSGTIAYGTEDKNIVAESGDIVILNKNSRYRAEFEGHDTKDILINFQCSGNLTDSDEDITIIRNCRSMENDFNEIFAHSTFTERSCVVKSIFYRIIDGITEQNRGNVLSAKIKSVIDADSAFEMNESDIAAACAVSLSTLQRTFKAAYGKTAAQYKNDVRMTAAKRLLMSGLYSVDEVAARLNFCDCAYFSRSFKKYSGMSPKQFIKQSYSII